MLSSIFGDWISWIFLWLEGFQKDIKRRNTIISLCNKMFMPFIKPYPVWLDILAFYILPLNVFIIKKTKSLITPIKLYFFFLDFFFKMLYTDSRINTSIKKQSIAITMHLHLFCINQFFFICKGLRLFWSFSKTKIDYPLNSWWTI